jgi:hypothetical protein
MTKRRKNRQLHLNVYGARVGAAPRLKAGDLLLEYFSDDQLLAWRAKGEYIQNYHYLWYFELESQRAAKQGTLLEALSLVPGITSRHLIAASVNNAAPDSRAGMQVN